MAIMKTKLEGLASLSRLQIPKYPTPTRDFSILETFTCFGNLPMDVADRIWQFAAYDCSDIVWVDERGDMSRRSRVPAMLLTSRHARREGLRYFTLTREVLRSSVRRGRQHVYPGQKSMYVNLDGDTFIFKGEWLGRTIDLGQEGASRRRTTPKHIGILITGHRWSFPTFEQVPFLPSVIKHAKSISFPLLASVSTPEIADLESFDGHLCYREALQRWNTKSIQSAIDVFEGTIAGNFKDGYTFNFGPIELVSRPFWVFDTPYDSTSISLDPIAADRYQETRESPSDNSNKGEDPAWRESYLMEPWYRSLGY